MMHDQSYRLKSARLYQSQAQNECFFPEGVIHGVEFSVFHRYQSWMLDATDLGGAGVQLGCPNCSSKMQIR